jgi:hypothetical protein
MMEWMVEVEDDNIAGPVDDMKKMKVFTILRTEGTDGVRKGEQRFRVSVYDVMTDGRKDEDSHDRGS